MNAEMMEGVAVEIERDDGTRFLAIGFGDIPAVWSNRNRSQAVGYKKELMKNGFKKCSVVPVRY